MHVTVPKVRPVAYLQATVKNTSDYRLLPGPMHAFVDNLFVSKSAIVGDVALGDAFEGQHSDENLMGHAVALHRQLAFNVVRKSDWALIHERGCAH